MSIPHQIQAPDAAAKPRAPWHRWLAVFLIAMAIVHGLMFWRARRLIIIGSGDITSFYSTGLMLRRGLGHQFYDRGEQWKIQQEFASRVEVRQGPLPFVRPPFEAPLFVPLTYFPYPVAVVLWVSFKLGLLLVVMWILRRPFGRIYPPWLEAILCLGLFPVFLDFIYGQDSILLLLLVVLAFNRLLDHHDAVAGIFLGLGLFKFNLVLPIVLLLCLAGRWRVLKGFVPVAVGLVAASVMIAGPKALLDYPAYLMNLNRQEGIGFVHSESMPNLRGLMSIVTGRASYPGPIHWILLPIALAAIVYAGHLWRAQVDGPRGTVLGYSLALVLSILTSYYSYMYDMTLLLVPLLLLASFVYQSEFDAVGRVFLISGYSLLLCAPLYGILFLRLEHAYLLSIPMALMSMGLFRAMKQPAGATHG